MGIIRRVIAALVEAIKAPAKPMLSRGSTGESVRVLQERLNAHGAGLRVDGIFGSRTDAAVRAVQAKRGLVVDAIVGPRTWGKLDG